jgi:hypothetical protein
MTKRGSIPLASLLAAAVLAQAAPARAQQASAPLPRVGVGFVANAPHQLLGVSVHAVSPFLGGLGIYVDAKIGIDSPRDEPGFDPDLTAEEVEDLYPDQLFTERSDWRSVNVALIRPVLPELMVYAGAGYSDESHYHQYEDVSGQRGDLGLYWVENPEESGSKVNLMGGAMFGISQNLFIQFGVETKPRGVTVGASYSLPLSR